MYAQLIEGGTTPDRRPQMDRLVTDEMVPALASRARVRRRAEPRRPRQRQRDDDRPLGHRGAGPPARSPSTAARSCRRSPTSRRSPPARAARSPSGTSTRAPDRRRVSAGPPPRLPLRAAADRRRAHPCPEPKEPVMSSIRPSRPLLGLVALLFVGLAFSAATVSAGAAGHAPSDKHQAKQQLVVRGEATVTDTPCGEARLPRAHRRPLPRHPGRHRRLHRRGHAQGRRAVPQRRGRRLRPDRRRHHARRRHPGPPRARRRRRLLPGRRRQPRRPSSFTGLAHFTVKHGTGSYADARGHGLATFSEDAADRDRMTLIGRIAS